MNKNKKYFHFTILAVIIFSFIIGSVSFFSRPILFYDEIINSQKAATWLVFDYALRPVFYWINAGFWQIFGGGQESLRFAYLLIFTIASSLSFLLTYKLAGFYCAIFAVFMFLFSGQNWTLAVTAMPHTPASIFVLLVTMMIINLLTEAWENNYISLKSLSVLAISLILGLLTHPTNLVLIPIAGVFVLVALIKIVLSHPKSLNINLLKASYFPIAIAMLVALVDCIFRYEIGRSYLVLWLKGLAKFDEPILLARYAKPFSYYTELLYVWLSVLLILSLMVFIFWFLNLILKIYQTGYRSIDTAENRNYLSLVLIMFGILLFISLSSWKFDRVIVGVYPLVVIWCAWSVKIFYNLLPMNRLIQGLKLSFLFYIALVFLNNFSNQVTLVSASTSNKNYIGRLGQILKALPDENVLYLGNRTGFGRGQVQIGYAGRKLISIDPEDRKKIPSKYCNFIKYLGKQQIRNILVHNSLPDSEKAKLNELINLGYLQFVYSDGKEFQLWKKNLIQKNSSVFNNIIIRDPNNIIYVAGVSKSAPVLAELNRLGFKTYKINLDISSEKIADLQPGHMLVAKINKVSQIEFIKRLDSSNFKKIANSKLLACSNIEYSLYSSTE
jgi:hypothetical protein